MNKYWKVASLLASGLVVGAIMGKVATQELGKSKRAVTGKSLKDIRNYVQSYYEEDDDHVYFV